MGTPRISSRSPPPTSSAAALDNTFGSPISANRPSWLANLPPGPKETPTQSVRKKHKTVRSLTREYESSASKENLASSSSDSVQSKQSHSSSSHLPEATSTLANAPASSRSHTKRNSVLIASSSFPSTFEAIGDQSNRARPSAPTRTVSGSSLTSPSDQGGIRLASSAYPSTYSSSLLPSSSAPLPLPTPPRPSPPRPKADMPASQGAPPVFTLSLDSPHSPAPNHSATSTSTETPSRLGVNTRRNSTLGRSASHGHSHSREWPSSTDATPERPRAVSANDASGGEEEEADQVGDLMRTQSTSTRKALSQMTAAERREHSRKHSRVHSRNLSVFFPQPGSAAEQEADHHRVQLNYPDERPHIYVDTSNGRAQAEASDGFSTTPDSAPLATTPSKSRRGHHSKHSVSYDMFSTSAETTATSSGLVRDDSLDSFLSFAPTSSPETMKCRSASLTGAHDHHHHLHSPHTHSHLPSPVGQGSMAYEDASATTATALPYPLSILAALPALPPNVVPILSFSIGHFILGSALWVAGQSSDSLSVTGLGYLVVFDSLGIFNEALSRWILSAKSSTQQAQKISSTYSMHRVSTLLAFVQTIYLLFAAVYVCKESIEHALLEGGDTVSDVIGSTALPGADLGGSASIVTGGGPGHHHHDHDEGGMAMELELPIVKIALAIIACVFSNLFMGNHAKLVAASGLSTTTSTSASSSRRHSRSQSVLVTTANLTGPVLLLLSNPYTITVLFFSTTLMFSGLTMSPFQVAALDKVLAGLESVTMWYIALPASKVLGRVLLQTSPNIEHEDEGGRTNTVQLIKAVKALEEHPLVHSIQAPHIWQLTPSTSAVKATNGSADHSLALSSPSSSTFSSRTAKSPTLIASLKIVLRKEASDSDILSMTKWAYQRCAPSVGAGMGVKVGEGLRGNLLAGELVVDVRRQGEAGCGHDDGHHHEHEHEHGHGHGHDTIHHHDHHTEGHACRDHSHSDAHHHHHHHHDHDHDHDHKVHPTGESHGDHAQSGGDTKHSLHEHHQHHQHQHKGEHEYEHEHKHHNHQHHHHHDKEGHSHSHHH